MSTLLLRLAGPMQSWGSRSRFATRGTESAPTKSGVVGLVAAALGIERHEPLGRFARVRFGVRIDQPGRIERDFQTARTLDGSASMPLSHRYYLADAVFLVGLEHSDRELLESFGTALTRPVFALSLGRRAFPPAGPIGAAVVDDDLEQALRSAPWAASDHVQREHTDEFATLDALLESTADTRGAEAVQDEPVSFDPQRRLYGWRSVVPDRFTVPNPHWTPSDPQRETGGYDHDPLALLPKGE